MHTMGHSSAVRGELWIHSTPWMGLMAIMLNEKSLFEKVIAIDRMFVFPPKFICVKTNSQDDDIMRWGLWKAIRSWGQSSDE